MEKTTFTEYQPLNASSLLIERLRDKEKGCPWLSSRRFEQLFPYFLEELYEYKNAVDQKGLRSSDAKQELADLLFQVILHSQLLIEAGAIHHFSDLASAVEQKLLRRHPHVFDEAHSGFKNAEEAAKAWESLKAKEARLAKRDEETRESMTEKMKRIPSELPALQRAARIGEKTQSFAFDWENPEQVLEKVKEEISEIECSQTRAEQLEEIGDALFSLAQMARHLDACPEDLAHKANEKFLRRFGKMESIARNWTNLSLAEKEKLWSKAKEIDDDEA